MSPCQNSHSKKTHEIKKLRNFWKDIRADRLSFAVVPKQMRVKASFFSVVCIGLLLSLLHPCIIVTCQRINKKNFGY